MDKDHKSAVQAAAGKLIRVPTGFLGLGPTRYFRKDEVRILEENYNSCSAMVGSPVLFETKDGEILQGYEPIEGY